MQEHLFELLSQDLQNLSRPTGQQFEKLINADAAARLCHNPG